MSTNNSSNTTTSYPTPINAINASTTAPRFCYLDLDLNDHRRQLARTAAFVAATDARYGFSSANLLALGGSELAHRVADCLANDHEWSSCCSGDDGDEIVQVRPPAAGNRIVVQLHWEVAPLACENFATLCANGGSSSSSSSSTAIIGSSSKSTTKKASITRRPAPLGACGVPLTYRGSPVHRIVPGFVLQGGDFVFGNGAGGESIFGGKGKTFKDERAGLLQKHDRRGCLSMGNSGRKNSNTSQWFVTLAAAPQCDGKHVVFGQVVSGWEVLAAAEALGSSSGTPTAPVVVTDCGVWNAATTPGAGYWYDQPDPDDAFNGSSPVFVVRPRVATVAPTAAVRDKLRQSLGGNSHHNAVVQAEFLLLCSSSSTDEEASVEENSVTAVAQQLLRLLQKCAVDVIVVAPACPVDALTTELANHWATLQEERTTTIPSLDQVLLTAKPLEALSVIRTRSWLAEQTQWQFDGQFSA